MTDAELFDYRCPYTDRLCYYEYDCANCEVETEERLWAEETEVDDADSN